MVLSNTDTDESSALSGASAVANLFASYGGTNDNALVIQPPASSEQIVVKVVDSDDKYGEASC